MHRCVITERKLEADLVAFEIGREGGKGLDMLTPATAARSKDSVPEEVGDHQFRNPAVPVDDELDQDLPSAPHLNALRYDRHPVTPDRRKYLHQIGLEIEAIGVAQQLEVAPHLTLGLGLAEPGLVEIVPESPTVMPPPPVGTRGFLARLSMAARCIRRRGSGIPFTWTGLGGATFSNESLGLAEAGGGAAWAVAPFGLGGGAMVGGAEGGCAAATWIFGGSMTGGACTGTGGATGPGAGCGGRYLGA